MTTRSTLFVSAKDSVLRINRASNTGDSNLTFPTYNNFTADEFDTFRLKYENLYIG